MNFLELCVKVRQKSDIPGVGPSSVRSQVGILEKVVGWVSDAWEDIQTENDWWLFMMASSSAQLNTGISNYTVSTFLPANFNYFWPKDIYLKLNGENRGQLQLVDWDEYVATYLHGTLSTGAPSLLSISPVGQIYFNTYPDQDYTIEFNYQKTKQTLADNDDEPTLPTDFHDVIWRRALVSYGEHFGAPEVYQSASLYLDERMDSLQARFIPKVGFRDNVYESS